jgi:hypothetical protein
MLQELVISTVVPAVFEGAVNPLAAKTWKALVGNPKFADLSRWKICFK